MHHSMTESNPIKTKLRNITNGKKYATGIIKEQEMNRHFRNEDLEAILQYHPNTIEKGVSNIDYLVVRLKQPYNDRSLYLKSHDNESEDSISYVICIQSMFDKFDQTRQDLLHKTGAFRNAIHNDYKTAFLYANTRDVDGCRYGECSRCKQDVKAVVDHYETSFKSILDSFCSTHNLTVAETKVVWEDNTPVIEDATIKTKWIGYHDNIVQYRILCRSCNSSLGCYGY